MSLLHPGLFAAAACSIALPILIHILLRRRRTPVMWGAMRFLLEAYQQQRRRIQFEQFLILALRCLLVAALGAAIARPYLADRNVRHAGRARTVYVILDDSLASSAMDGAGRTTFERSQEQAVAVLKSLDSSRGDRAALITVSTPAEGLVVSPSIDPGAVIRQVMALTPTSAAADWNQSMVLAAEAFAASQAAHVETTQEIVLCTGGRAGSLDPKRAIARPPTLLPSTEFWIAPPEEQVLSNVSIVDVAPLNAVLTGASGTSEAVSIGQVRVSLRRSGSLGAATTKVRLEIPARDGVSGKDRVTEQTITWSAGEAERMVTVSGPRLRGSELSEHPVLVASIDRDAIEADNSFAAPLIARDTVRVGLIAARAESRILSGESVGGASNFSPADWVWIGLDPGAATTSLTERGGDIQRSWIDPAAVGATSLTDFDALVLTSPERLDRDTWKRLRVFTDAGGVLLVTPGAATAAQAWTDGFTEAFSPAFSIGREVTNLEPAQALVFDGASRPAWDPLKGLVSEAAELVKPVRISKVLGLSASGKAQDATPAILAIGSGAGQTTPLLVQVRPQDGAGSRGVCLLLTACPVPAWTDLPARPFFVPLLHEVIRSGIARAGADGKQLAGHRVRVPGGTSAVRMARLNQTLAVDATGQTTEGVRRADIATAVDGRGAAMGVIGVNADWEAADVATQDRGTISRTLATLLEGGTLNFLDGAPLPGAGETEVQSDLPINPERRWSVWLFVFAGALALAEIALGKKFSHAQPSAVRSALDIHSTASENAA